MAVMRTGSLDELRAENAQTLAGSAEGSPERTQARVVGALLDLAAFDVAEMPGASITIDVKRVPSPYDGGPVAIYGNVYVHPAPAPLVAPAEIPVDGPHIGQVDSPPN